MATSVISQQQSSHSMRTQSSFQSQKSYQLKTPDGDLKDVEADFQSLVNEMARDGGPSKRVVQQETRSFSSSSQYSMTNGSGPVRSSSTSSMVSSSGKSSSGKLASSRNAAFSSSNSIDGIVTAMPARVVPVPVADVTERGGGESEVIVERSMKVRDRVKKLETQLSQEDLANSPVPDALMSPRYKSGSIKNLADQFNNAQVEAPSAPVVNAVAFGPAKDSVELINNSDFRGVKQIASVFDKAEMSSQEDISRRVEGEFKSVRETAAKYQEPIQVMPTPVRASPAFKTESDAEIEEDVPPPVAVLPPATLRKAPSSPPPRPVEPTVSALSALSTSSSMESSSTTKKQENFFSEDLKNFESALTDVSKSAELLSADSTESRSTSAETVVQQPLQYSAKVTCEVRSRVTTPEVVEQSPFTISSNQVTNKSITETNLTRRSRSETRTSTTTGSTTSISSSNSRTAAANQQKISAVGGVKSASSNVTSTFKPASYSTSSSSSSVAAFTGKPPKSDMNEPTKLSLLRSSSTGSVASDLKQSTTMTRIGSERDLPKFNIKKIKPVGPRKFRVLHCSLS